MAALASQAPDDEEKKQSIGTSMPKDVSAEWVECLKPKFIKPEKPSRWNRGKNDFSALFEKLRAHKCEHRLNDDGSVTFFPSPYLPHSKLARKKRSKVSFAESAQYENIMKEVTCDAKKLEAIYDTKATVVQAPHDVHGFIACLELAFFEHYPMALSPSVIWLLILQSLGMHIDNNAEKLRDKFVTHQDKKELTIILGDDFVKGSPDNSWDAYIENFAAQIDKNTIDDVVSLLETDFSTTSAVERIAGKVAIMDLMKHYFVYRMAAGCGFPQITLTGTKKDWVAMKQKLTALLQNKVDKKFGKSWADAVMPVLDRFIDAFDGKIDCLFWNSMLRRGAAGGSRPGIRPQTDIKQRSGRMFYSGWFNVFFPLVNPSNGGQKGAFAENKHCVAYQDSNDYVQCGLEGASYGGPKMETLPSGISSAPVNLVLDKEYEMKFVAGFFGVDQDEETLEVSPKIGWLIGEQ